MDIRVEIERLKRARKGVILAHNYQPPEIQDIADFTGDSLELSVRASEVQSDVIVFCGVSFMAETAAVLAKGKTVLNPEPSAVCPMANMINPEDVKHLKERHKGCGVMCYVNTSADVKADSDICCTSSNAELIAGECFDRDQEVVFIPDRNLALNTAGAAGRRFITWPGYCPTHARILPEHIKRKRYEHPHAEVLVHPECRPETCALSDRLLSTGQMRRYVQESGRQEFIIGTEEGMLYRLRSENPEKSFYIASDIAVCPNMKKNALNKVLDSMKNMETRVEVEESVRERAGKAITRMIEISKRG